MIQKINFALYSNVYTLIIKSNIQLAISVFFLGMIFNPISSLIWISIRWRISPGLAIVMHPDAKSFVNLVKRRILGLADLLPKTVWNYKPPGCFYFMNIFNVNPKQMTVYPLFPWMVLSINIKLYSICIILIDIYNTELGVIPFSMRLWISTISKWYEEINFKISKWNHTHQSPKPCISHTKLQPQS